MCLNTNYSIYTNYSTFNSFCQPSCLLSIRAILLQYFINNSSKGSGPIVVAILPFDSAAAFDYGEIRHYLKARGIIISGNDMLIAAHARSLGITLVTHNTREFSRVQNLMLEDWVI